MLITSQYGSGHHPYHYAHNITKISSHPLLYLPSHPVLIWSYKRPCLSSSVIRRRISLDLKPMYWKTWSHSSAIIPIKLIFKICRFFQLIVILVNGIIICKNTNDHLQEYLRLAEYWARKWEDAKNDLIVIESVLLILVI